MVGRLADQLADQTRPAPIEPMAQLSALSELGPSSPVQLSPGLRLRFERSDAALVVRALDARISLDLSAESALKQLQSGQAVPAGQLAGLDVDAALELSRRLLTAAVLVPGV